MISKKPSPSLTLRPLTSLEKALLRQHPLPSQIRSPLSSPSSNSSVSQSPSQTQSPNFLEKLLLSQNGPSPFDMESASENSRKGPQPQTSNAPSSPKKSPKDSKGTSHPSSSSDLTQALLALRDLVEVLPLSTDPYLVSAYQEARMVLRKHGVETNGTVRT